MNSANRSYSLAILSRSFLMSGKLAASALACVKAVSSRSSAGLAVMRPSKHGRWRKGSAGGC